MKNQTIHRFAVGLIALATLMAPLTIHVEIYPKSKEIVVRSDDKSGLRLPFDFALCQKHAVRYTSPEWPPRYAMSAIATETNQKPSKFL